MNKLKKLVGATTVVVALGGLLTGIILADGNSSGSYSCRASCAGGSCSASGSVTDSASTCCVDCSGGGGHADVGAPGAKLGVSGGGSGGGCTATGYNPSSYPYQYNNKSGE